MSKTTAVHVRYKAWYISLQSSGKQQSEITNFCVDWRLWTTTANYSYLEFNAAFEAYSARASFNTDRHTPLIVLNKWESQFQSTIECTHSCDRQPYLTEQRKVFALQEFNSFRIDFGQPVWLTFHCLGTPRWRRCDVVCIRSIKTHIFTRRGPVPVKAIAYAEGSYWPRPYYAIQILSST